MGARVNHTKCVYYRTFEAYITATYVQLLWKILHTPNLSFEIHQIALNPNAKFLAIAGAYQVAVVVLPRATSTRLASNAVDCKSVIQLLIVESILNIT